MNKILKEQVTIIGLSEMNKNSRKKLQIYR